MDYEKTGRLIKKKRLALGLTQLQLSEMLAVTPQAVSLWEKRETFSGCVCTGHVVQSSRFESGRVVDRVRNV